MYMAQQQSLHFWDTLHLAAANSSTPGYTRSHADQSSRQSSNTCKLERTQPTCLGRIWGDRDLFGIPLSPHSPSPSELGDACELQVGGRHSSRLAPGLNPRRGEGSRGISWLRRNPPPPGANRGGGNLRTNAAYTKFCTHTLC